MTVSGPLRWALRGSMLCAAMSLGVSARAQTVTVNEAEIDRDIPLRERAEQPTAINFADCTSGGNLLVPLEMQNFGSNALEVWVGGSVDCSDYEERHGASPSCWLVKREPSPVVRQTIAILLQDIAAARTTRDSPNGPESGTTEDCTERGKDSLPISLHFLAVGADGHTVPGSTGASWSTILDMIGPPPPSEVSAGVGEGQLVVEWKAPTAQEDRRGYRAFCDPEGVASDPGAATATCDSATLTAGEIPPLDLQCGEVSSIVATEVTAGDLENGATYAVGVASFDAVGNVGVLSDLACGTPQLVDNFFEEYRRAGGQGGGGYCALGRASSPAWLALAPLALLVLCRRKARAS